MKKLIISENDAGQRLDKFINKALPNLPVSLLYKFIRKKRIKINKKKCNISTKLNVNDVLKLYIKDEFFEKNQNEKNLKNITPKLDIIYEDENIVLINKPVGMLAHPDENGSTDCVINRFKSYLFLKGEYNPEEENSFAPALANRIDRNTSGIIIAAKNAESLRILNQKIKARELKKSYLCVVVGVPKNKEQISTAFLSKNLNKNQVYINPHKTNSRNERMIKTKYTVLDEKKNFSLLEIELITGRTHQIRAHMAFLGHPLLGDGKYGINKINKMCGEKTQVLCSYKLEFLFSSDAGLLNYLNGKKFEIKNVKKEMTKLLENI